MAQGLNNFRKDLRDSIGKTSIPYNLVTWKCNSTSFDNYNKIAACNQQILVNERKLEQELGSLSSCPQITQLKENIDLL